MQDSGLSWWRKIRAVSPGDPRMNEALSPIVRTFEVNCSIDHAFETWTRQMNLWWPLARHSVSHGDAASVTVEPWQGGRIFETTRDGRQITWGTVNAWDPPNRFGYLWHIREPDASAASQVVIAFTGLDSSRTQVSIRHEGWERAGPHGGPRRQGNEWGWDGVIPAYQKIIAAAERRGRLSAKEE